VNGTSFTNVSSPYTITGLTNGTSYLIIIVAINSIGTSAPASISGTPAGGPSAVTNLTGTPANNSVVLNWGPPTQNGGSPIGNYRVNYMSPVFGNTNAAVIDLTYTVTGLTNGIPTVFTVSAYNGFVFGAEVSVTVTPGNPTTVPGPPGSFSSAGAPNSIPGSLYLFQGTQSQALAMLPAILPNTTNLVTGGTARGILMVWRTPTTNGGLPIDYYIYIYRQTNRAPINNFYSAIPGEIGGTTVYAIWQSPIIVNSNVTVVMAAHNANGFSTEISRTYYFA
jgi:hypothetical protein